MKTWISDNFPLKELECQYFDICRDYKPKLCNYSAPCELRQWLREIIEPYQAKKNLELQIGLILDDEKNKNSKKK